MVDADPWDRSEQSDRRRDDQALADPDGCSVLDSALLLTGEHMKPERRVLWSPRVEQTDPVVEDLEQRPTNRTSGNGASIQVVTFNEHISTTWIAAECCHLAPQSPIDKRAVEVGDGLAFDYAIADGVVADGKSDGRKADSKRSELRWYV